MYDIAILRRASARLDERRRRHEDELAQTRAGIFRAVPQVAELDRQLRGTITGLISASLRSGDDPGPAVETARSRNLQLQARQAALLAEAGYPEDILDDTPLCPNCGDSGWLGATMCGCLRALCAEEQIRELSFLLNLGEQSFDKFSFDWYTDRPWPGEDRSPKENMQFVLTVCREYAERFGRFYFKNLFLSGPPGLGKTFLSACIARAVSEGGHSAVYDTAANVFSRFETQKFSRDAGDVDTAKDETRRYLNCDLLILDDLGSEFTTPFVQSALHHIVNTRLVEGRHTVISSNLGMEDVRRKYTPQTASRLEGEYRVLTFYGDDIRILRKRRL